MNGLLRHSPSVHKGLSSSATPPVPVLGTPVVISDTQINIPVTSTFPYEMWYSTDNVTYTKHGDGTTTPYEATVLTAGTLYYFKARGVNGSKYSDYSGAVSATTQISPYQSDLNLWAIGRSGLTMTDTIGENDVTIIPSCGVIDANNYLYKSINNFEAADSSGYIEAKINFANTTQNIRLFSSVREASTTTYFEMYIGTDKRIGLTIRSAATVVFTNTLVANDVLSAAGVYTIRWSSNGSSYALTVNGQNTAFTATVGSNDGKWLNVGYLAVGRSNIAIGARINTSSQYTGTATNIYYVDYNNKHKWIITGEGKYAYDSIGTDHMSWVGTAHIAYDSNMVQDLMTVGYTYATKGGEPDEYIPYKNSLPNDVSTFLSGYAYVNCVGNANYFNLAPSVINVPIDNYDRSDTDRFTDDARTGADYNVSFPNRWKPRDLVTPTTYYEWGNTGYKGSIGSKADNSSYNFTLLKEILSYTNDKEGIEQYRVMQYNTVESFAVLDDQDDPIYDENNYVTLI